MSRAIRAAIGRLERYVLDPACPGRRDIILRGNGVFGMRAAPTPCRDNDRVIGIRLVYGEVLLKEGVAARRYYVRANKNAHDRTLRALTRKTYKLSKWTPDEDAGSAEGTKSAQTPTDANANGAALEKLGTHDKYEIEDHRGRLLQCAELELLQLEEVVNPYRHLLGPGVRNSCLANSFARKGRQDKLGLLRCQLFEIRVKVKGPNFQVFWSKNTTI
ncbi:hypothetical protein E4U30_004730 [Claviceps sp. LM220 group G6]|nr:hypothetical protein E4U15_003709 [Claviceps sp. LM218 group G6]KAG6100414.1 hypothetical protein E4U30_004730 [Claviceps sp. LM220 group G6]